MHISRILPLLALLLTLSSPLAAAEPPRIEIYAWLGVPADQTSVQRYRELADCGFTLSYSGFPDLKSTTAALNCAQAAGIKLFISPPQLQQNPEDTIRRLEGFAALGGYHLRDEPSAADFPELAKWANRIQAVDKTHPCFINLFPTYASPQQLGVATYQEHVDRFLKEVDVPILSFDHYPVIGKTLRGDWYQNLEIMHAAAQKSGKPLWAFALSVAHGPYPIPTLAHLRVQVYSDLAYGAQCIEYFTYWTPVDATWNFHTAPIDPKGNRTPTYAVVQAMNREIKAVSPVFAGSKVIAVAHTGQLPAGTRKYEPQGPVKSLTTTGPGAVVSTLENGDKRYLAIVNRDINAPMKLQVQFDPAARVVHLDKSLKDHPLDNASFTTQVAPGDLCLFTWPAAR